MDIPTRARGTAHGPMQIQPRTVCGSRCTGLIALRVQRLARVYTRTPPPAPPTSPCTKSTTVGSLLSCAIPLLPVLAEQSTPPWRESGCWCHSPIDPWQFSASTLSLLVLTPPPHLQFSLNTPTYPTFPSFPLSLSLTQNRACWIRSSVTPATDRSIRRCPSIGFRGLPPHQRTSLNSLGRRSLFHHLFLVSRAHTAHSFHISWSDNSRRATRHTAQPPLPLSISTLLFSSLTRPF